MRKLYHCGLESYESRYTKQLTQWNIDAFTKHGWIEGNDYEIIKGNDLTSDKDIKTGAVLDAHGRTYYALTQIANLVRMLHNGDINGDDVIFFEDLFTPGLESLPYIFDQIPSKNKPRVYVRCLAQTIDPDDFVNKTGMFKWMRPFEHMVDQFVDGILVASEEMVAHLRIAGFQAPIYVTGLPFGKDEVLSRMGISQDQSNLPALKGRKNQVVWASRWDEEKQPHFFMNLIERFRMYDRSVKFIICSGGSLRSNDQNAVDRIRELAAANNSNVEIRENLSKNEYYQTLLESRVLFNCALQDWVSNTLSEADTLGCITIYPAYRSFPEAFANNHNHMYIPWSHEDAFEKLARALSQAVQTPYGYQIGKMSNYQDKTIYRTLDVFEGNGSRLRRDFVDSRAHIAKAKF